MTSPLCLFFGCWGRPGHHLVGPGGSRVVGQSDLPNSEAYDLCNALDSGFAPRRTSSGLIVFGLATFGMGWEIRTAEELPQGQFLRHRHGRWTLLQWWDRCQGDTRGACNSTVLLEGDRTTGECLAALRTSFPEVVANLDRHGVELVELFLSA